MADANANLTSSNSGASSGVPGEFPNAVRYASAVATVGLSATCVGGKTGTADKPKPRGGYYEDKVIATFASIFPAHDPKYALVVTLDEPSIVAHGEERRTAGWTAVPVAAEMIGRVAPLLGLRPQVEPAEVMGITLTSN